MNRTKSREFEAFILGLGSIATQAAFIKLILSSQVGGEIYAALAIGGWIIAVGTGVFLATKIKAGRLRALWLLSALVKIPLAFFIFIYPAFFTGILDPLRFLPLILIGIAPTGIIYGLIFPLLITEETKTSMVYRNEAAGSVVGGLLILLFAYLGLGNFVLLFLLSGIEFAIFWQGKYRRLLIPAILLIIGIYAGPWLDKTGLDIRWPGFKTETNAHGFSGLWAVHSRGKQLTISHNGRFTHTIPDRQSSEEALLWPFLYRPDAKDILLIGFEGIEAENYLPSDIAVTRLVSDKASLRLGIDENKNIIFSDPLSYSTDKMYDIVNLYLESGGDLADYRLETKYFFNKCKRLLSTGGVLFISATSDENYIAPELGGYLSGIYSALSSLFDSVTVIPGPRIGFICHDGEGGNPLLSIREAGIESPYFNQPLIINRLMPFRINQLKNQIPESSANYLLRPSAVVDYLQWTGSMFGRGKYLFQIYRFPYPLIYFPALLAIPVMVYFAKKSGFYSYLTVAFLGSLGLGTEIAIIFLFQILFGNLYFQLGIILALFMAGMAVGANFATRLKIYMLTGPILICLILIALLPTFMGSDSGMDIILLLLYVASAAAGFCSGGGFAYCAERRSDDRHWGATLYSIDLYGALTAAIFVPGIILALGMTILMLALIAIDLIISATLCCTGR